MGNAVKMRFGKKHQSLAFQLYLCGMPLVVLVSLFCYILFGNNIYSLITGFLFVFCFTLLYVIRYFGIISLYSIFLCTSSFFIYDAFWFSLFDRNKNFLFQTFPTHYFFDSIIGVKFLLCCVLLTYVMHIAYCLIYYKRRLAFRQVHVHRKEFELFGIGIMLLFFIPSIVKLYIQFMYIKTHGYLAIFKGELAELKYPIWTAGANLLFVTGFSIFVASNPSKRKFIFFSSLLFLLMAFNGAKGQRGVIIGPMVALLYWFTKKYDITLKLKSVFILFVFIIGITYALGSLRSSYGQNTKVSSKNIHVLDLVSNVLYSQTNSRAVPMTIIKGDLPYHNYPFIFSPIFSFLGKIAFPSKGQDDVSLKKYNDISSITVYSVSPRAYFRGNGYGGAFIAEAYDCGGFLGIIIWGVILAFFIAFCDYSSLKIKNTYIPFLFLILLNFAMLPRDRFLAVLNNHLPKILILLLILPVIREKLIWRCYENEK